MAFQNSTNLYSNTKYVVSGAGGTPYTTIQSAIDAANTAAIAAVIYIRPGAYTENLTLYDDIALEGSETTLVSITGSHTPPTSGELSFTRIEFIATGTDDVLANANAGTTDIKFSRCGFSVADGYICDLPLWTGNFDFIYCSSGTSVKNGIINNGSSTSNVEINNCILGYGTDNAMTVNGIVKLENTKIYCPITLGGSEVSVLEGGSTFKGTITVNADADLQISNSRIATTTSSGLIIDSSVVVKLSNVVIDSEHAYAIRTSNPTVTSGSYKPSCVTFPDGKEIGADITEILTGVVKTGEIFADTVTRMEDTGFYAWSGAAPYFDDTTLGSFTILAAGAGSGYIKGRLIEWAGPQTVTSMTSGSTWFIYIDEDGVIGKASTRTDALFVDNIVLFECLYDETAGTKQQHTVRENHPYSFPVASSNYLHNTVGSVIENLNDGARIAAGTTAVRVSIEGADELVDHGLQTTIPEAADVSWKKFYKNAGGKWAIDATGTDFAGRWSNGGVPEDLTASKYAVYRLYVGTDSGNATTPIYYGVLHTAQFSNQGAAATAIADGDISVADGELALLELAQLGYITQGPSAAGDIIVFTIDKSTLRSTISGGAGSSTASGVTTNTVDFDGILSGADTNVQAALNTIDNFGAGTTDKALIVGNGVGSALGALAVGGTGTLLTGVAANDPTWTTATYPATAAIGTILVASGANVITTLAPDTAGHVLTDGGAGAAPSWVALPAAGEAQAGVVELATDAEAIAGTASTVINCTSLKAKLGAQTSHGLPYGAATTSAIAWTAEPTDGQLLIGDTGGVPVLATLTAGTGITITNAAHAITVASTNVTLNDQTDTTYTLVLSDAGKFLTFTNASDITVTVPTHASVAFPVGTIIAFSQGGAGQVIFEGAAPPALHSADDALTTVKLYSGGCMVQTAEDVWQLFGDLEA